MASQVHAIKVYTIVEDCDQEMESQEQQHLATNPTSNNGNAVDTTTGVLMLPAELRNRIYRFALVSSSPVSIGRTSFAHPAFLEVCRQIRKEAISIYYYENTFAIEAPDFDPSTIRAFYWRVESLYRVYQLSPTSITKQYDVIGSHRNWTNIMKLLKLFHSKKVPGCRTDDRSSKVQRAVTGACQIAAALRNRPWAEVEPVLQVYKDNVARGNGGGWIWEA